MVPSHVRIRLDWVYVLLWTGPHLFQLMMYIVIHMFRSMNMLEEIKAKWDEILLNIKEEHDISEVSYRTWLLPLIPDSVDKDILTILVPDSAFISYVKRKYEFLR